MKEKKRSVAVVLLLLFALCVSLISPTMASTPKLNTTKKTVVKGQSVKLKVKNTSKAVKWSTSNKKVATVRKTGKTRAIVKTKKAGKVTITAKVGSKKLKCKITVNAMGLNKSSVSLKTGSSTTLKVINGKKVSWTSSNSKVVKITSKTSKTAKIKGLKSGKATITAKVGKKKFVCKVTVTKRESDRCIIELGSYKKGIHWYSPDGKNYSIDVAYLHLPYTYEQRFMCDCDQGFSSWKSSDPSIISVRQTDSEKAEFTFKKIGSVTISFSHNGKTYNWTLKLTDSDAKYKIKRDQIYQQVGITNDMKPQYKCFLIAKWMCENITYKAGSTIGQTYQEAFDEGTAVCAGYANAYKYLLEGLGIPCEYVSSKSMNHAWNQVQIDGKWYNVDVSLMDYDQDQDKSRSFIMHAFLVSDKVMDLSAYNPHPTDTRFDNCYNLYVCRTFHHSDNNKMTTIICNENHNICGYPLWKDFSLYCPWANGEWVNY